MSSERLRGHDIRCARRLAANAGALLAVTLVAACSSSTGVTAPFPSIAGPYVVSLTATLSAPGDPAQVENLPAGSLSFDSASRSGAFTGSYALDGVLGFMTGKEAVNGSLQFSTFGMDQTTSYPPLENAPLITQVFPNCDWSTATGGEMTGQVVQATAGAPRSVSITGTVQVQCTVSGSTSPVPSTVTLTASGDLQAN